MLNWYGLSIIVAAAVPALLVLWWVGSAPPLDNMKIVRVTPQVRMLYVAVCNKCSKQHKVRTQKIATRKLT